MKIRLAIMMKMKTKMRKRMVKFVISKLSNTVIMQTTHEGFVWSEYIIVWTNTAVILALRLLLIKILTFNTLMTTYVVIKW